MEKWPMCRICLVQNVRMFVVVNRNLRELYEKLTDIPFVTEDRRPMLACFFCCAKLKQCYRLLRQCLKGEELFARKMNDDYETKPLINQDHLEFYRGFIKSPIVHINIVGEGQTESIAIKEETPAVCEGLALDDFIESKEEYQSEELELENIDNSCLDEAGIPPQHSESDSEDDVPLIEFQTEVDEEQEVYKKKRKARDTKSASVKKKPKLDTRRTKLDALTTEGMKKDKSVSKVIRTTRKRLSKPGTYFKEPNKCDQRSVNRVKKNIQQTSTQIGEKSYKCNVCQRSFTHNCHLTKHLRIHTGEKPYKCDVCQRSFIEKGALNKHNRIHTGEKPYKCDSCERSFTQKSVLINHIRRHTGEKPYKCNVCHHSFRDKGALANHNRIHTGKKPYTCDICQHSFRDKGALTNHYRIHTGEKPFKCDICECSFRQIGHLTSHMRNHTGEKPFKCDICLCNFRQIGHLTKHIRVHTGEKPFKRSHREQF